MLLELGFLQDDGDEVDPIVVPAGLSACHSFDYSQFPSEDDGTPALLQHHQQHLSGFEVQFGRSKFQMYDIHHRKDLKLISPSGVSYTGGLDGVAAPWKLAKAGAVSEMRMAYNYEHKQSSAQKQAYREANSQYHEVNLLHKQSRSGKFSIMFSDSLKGAPLYYIAACLLIDVKSSLIAVSLFGLLHCMHATSVSTSAICFTSSSPIAGKGFKMWW